MYSLEYSIIITQKSHCSWTYREILSDVLCFILFLYMSREEKKYFACSGKFKSYKNEVKWNFHIPPTFLQVKIFKHKYMTFYLEFWSVLQQILKQFQPSQPEFVLRQCVQEAVNANTFTKQMWMQIVVICHMKELESESLVQDNFLTLLSKSNV